MNLKPVIPITAMIACLGAHLTAAPITDDFTGGLGDWTSTVILDAGGTGSNAFAFQVNGSDQLEVNTTAYDGIEQVAFIRSGAALAVGEEAQVSMTLPITINQNFGLYVGGTAPVTGVRQDYISVYGHTNGQLIRTRGFNGTSEYNNLTASTPDGVTTLFIARTAANSYEVGWYDVDGRQVITTRTPSTANSGDVVGVYADVRAAGVLGAIDSFRIVAPPYFAEIDNTEFQSGLSIGDLVGILSASVGGISEASTFSLVAGDGDTDNGLFQIGGAGSDELEVNADFTAAGLDPADGSQFFVRVRGDSDGSSSFEEIELVLTLTKDDDLDNLLDDWELMWRPDLTDLSAVFGTEDFDNDGLWDIEEYQISIGVYPGYPALPTIDPTTGDTDGDTLTDSQEVWDFQGFRPATNPVVADSDFDGLTDFEETNSGVAEILPLVGSDPTFADADGDGSKDGFEVANGTDPLDHLDHPVSVSPSVTVTRITDDASSEISSTKIYTHAVSGGSAVTVNGVAFEILDDSNSATNFVWAPDGDGRNSAVAIGGSWDTVNGGVTGTGVIDLLTGFAYSDTARFNGGGQTYTLSGLTPGTDYNLRLYVRQWTDTDSGRPLDITFTNGAEVVTPYCALLLDRPAYVLNDAGLNHDQAYFLSFAYTAQGTDLVIRSQTPMGFGDADDNLHLYGLTNEVAGPELFITGIARNGSGEIVIDFIGPASESFSVTKSADLSDGFPSTAETVGPVTTDAGGIGQAVVTAAEASDPAEFYRIEFPAIEVP